MPEKLHSRIIKKFGGVDYGSNDLDRDIEYFKDCENVELSYAGGIRGRVGYRPLIVDMGFTDIFDYATLDLEGNEYSEKILVNGNLWRVKNSYFNITTATSASFNYDYNSTVNIQTTVSDPPLVTHPLTLTVNFVKFSTETHRNLGTLWDALASAFHTITHPSESQMFVWAKIASNQRITSANGITSTFTYIGGLQVNDIIGVPCVMVENLKMIVPCVVLSISGFNVKLRPALTQEYTNSTGFYSLYEGKSVGGYVGIASTSSSCITSVEAITSGGFRVNYVYPEPIPSPCLYTTGFSGVYVEYGTKHSLLGYAVEPLDNVDYSVVNASDSLFIACDKNPITYVK